MATFGVRLTDSANDYDEAALTITVADINDAPIFALAATSYSGTVAESQAAGATVTFGTTIAATDEDGDTRVYGLAGWYWQ